MSQSGGPPSPESGAAGQGSETGRRRRRAYDVPQVQQLLEAAARRRNGARWPLALALGLRQGEALGLTWDDVDLGKGTIRIHQSRLRPKYAHGCAGTCG